MINSSHLCRRMQHLCGFMLANLRYLYESIRFFLFRFHRFIVLRTNLFLLQVLYFISLSSFGCLVLKCLKPRTHGSFGPTSLDLFFTSVSTVTVSSMSTVEMEVFSNTQLIVITLLMFAGGEVFTSMVGLHLRRYRMRMLLKTEDKVASVESDLSIRSLNLRDALDGVELGLTEKTQSFGPYDCEYLRYRSIGLLGAVVLGYLVVVQVLGVAMVSIYLGFVSTARDVLRNKGLNMLTFCVFITVSTFARCGFVPTNENMIVFRNNSAFLLILIPLILLGSTLFPSCLGFCLWVIHKFRTKAETSYLLRNTSEIGYLHLLPSLHSRLLVATVLGLIGIQFVIFSAMQWNSKAFGGLGPSEKAIGILFQCVNSRHTGETIVDLSTIAPAMLVLFVFMMYLPPYTSFLPVNGDGERSHATAGKRLKIQGKITESLVLSQLSYVAIFIITICITERDKMKEDPLNFSVLNIVVEVISAYGNVGFTTGYSCKRQLKPETGCTEKWFGFAGRWSDQGKIILIIVMFFGRLKKFNMNGGRGWKLL
ncbi:probable cation transporter HKT7 isoform X4 [Punica granatum]|nr:probable cation transporter HKT7 isoform X4 [Punica granatum]